MRVLFGLLLSMIIGSANAAIIQIDYTGFYQGSISSGNPAISQINTVQVGRTDFHLTFIFDTLAPFAFFMETPTSSSFISNFNPNGGELTGTFSISGYNYIGDSATSGFTSQTIADQTISKTISNTPSLTLSASHPDIPASITQPYTILSGLTGSGSYSFLYVGNFSYLSETFVLTPETISVTVDGISAAVPEPSTWAMLLIGFAGIAFALSKRRSRPIQTRET
jgi:hypothetical protein